MKRKMQVEKTRELIVYNIPKLTNNIKNYLLKPHFFLILLSKNANHVPILWLGQPNM
jgi:hypothetical protein